MGGIWVVTMGLRVWWIGEGGPDICSEVVFGATGRKNGGPVIHGRGLVVDPPLKSRIKGPDEDGDAICGSVVLSAQADLKKVVYEQ